jgi:hypothetical protein
MLWGQRILYMLCHCVVVAWFVTLYNPACCGYCRSLTLQCFLLGVIKRLLHTMTVVLFFFVESDYASAWLGRYRVFLLCLSLLINLVGQN